MIFVYIIGAILDTESFDIEDSSSLVLGNGTMDSINPQFSVSEDRIYASWISNINSQNSEVIFNKIDNAVKSFINTKDISKTPGISNIIKLRHSKNNVYITWEDKQADQWKLLFRKSQDYGERFGNVTNLSKTTGNVHLHDLSAEGKNLFVVWAANENTTSKNKEVFFRKSLNYGDSFSDTVNLSNSNDDSLDPHMIINRDGSMIYIVWTECDIRHDDPICRIVFTRSLDQGNTFTIPKRVSDTVPSPKRITSYPTLDSESKSNASHPYIFNNATVQKENYSINPSIFATIDGKKVYVLWEDDLFGTGRSEIFLTVSNDYGKSFNSTINVSNTSGISRLAQGELEGQDLYVVWSDTLEGNNSFDVMLRKIDSNNIPGKVINLSNNAANSVSPFLLVRNSTIFVSWADEANKSSIILWNGDSSGSTGIIKKLNTRYAEFFSSPLIFDTKDKVWISWTEYYNNKHRIVLIDP
jgi:hypothetical protein